MLYFYCFLSYNSKNYKNKNVVSFTSPTINHYILKQRGRKNIEKKKCHFLMRLNTKENTISLHQRKHDKKEND